MKEKISQLSDFKLIKILENEILNLEVDLLNLVEEKHRQKITKISRIISELYERVLNNENN